jgi:hypothetical protein
MPEAPPLTLQLALRIEGLIAPSVPIDASRSEPGAPAVAKFGQHTIAMKARGGKPSNKVFCFGHDDVAYLDAILEFYAVDDLEPSFYLSPMRYSPDVAAALIRAGFVQRDFAQTILYGVPEPSPAPPTPHVSIEPVTTENLDIYVHTLADGFEWPDAWRNAAIEGARKGFGTRPGSHTFLARFDGEPAGVGSLGVRDGRIGSLAEGAVVPKFRRRGCHLALVRHRMHVAHQLGCDFMLGAANFGNSSFGNQQRAGLRLAYIESGWFRMKN